LPLHCVYFDTGHICAYRSSLTSAAFLRCVASRCSPRTKKSPHKIGLFSPYLGPCIRSLLTLASRCSPRTAGPLTISSPLCSHTSTTGKLAQAAGTARSSYWASLSAGCWLPVWLSRTARSSKDSCSQTLPPRSIRRTGRLSGGCVCVCVCVCVGVCVCVHIYVYRPFLASIPSRVPFSETRLKDLVNSAPGSQANSQKSACSRSLLPLW